MIYGGARIAAFTWEILKRPKHENISIAADGLIIHNLMDPRFQREHATANKETARRLLFQ